MAAHGLPPEERDMSTRSEREIDETRSWASDSSPGDPVRQRSKHSLASTPKSPVSPVSVSNKSQSSFAAGPRRSLTFTSDAPSAGANKRRGSVVAMGNFVKQDSRGSVSTTEVTANLCLRLRAKIIRAVQKDHLANAMALVVLVDAYLTGLDIDARAGGGETAPTILLMSDICLFLYTAEFFLMLAVRGFVILKDWMIVLDTVIILCGFAEMAMTRLDLAGELASRLGVLRVLRLARIVRLMNLLRKSRSLKELQKLVIMLTTCMKALAWSFLFCFVIMTMWAMMLVEIVNPLIQQINEQTPSPFESCGEQCLKATSSVMDANLLLFKTVIAGDSWGQIAVPVINKHPETAIIFVGSLLTLVFGVLNLIVAVVVDTFAEVRESDVLNLAQELDHNLEVDKKILQKIFERLDVDGQGEVTMDQLLKGARNDAEFQSRLRVMDIDEVDLRQLFEMIDVDGSGAIEAEEFVVPLSRWVHDSKTAPRFIKYNLMHTMHQQEELLDFVKENFTWMSQTLSELVERLGGSVSVGSYSTGVPIAPFRRPSQSQPNPTLASASTGEGGTFEVPEMVEQPHLSKTAVRLRPRPADEALSDALAAINRSLSQALELSLGEAEGILQARLEEFSRGFEPPPPSAPLPSGPEPPPRISKKAVQLQGRPSVLEKRELRKRTKEAEAAQTQDLPGEAYKAPDPPENTPVARRASSPTPDAQRFQSV